MTILSEPLANLAAYEYRVVGDALPHMTSHGSTAGLSEDSRRALVEGFARASEVVLVVEALLEACLEQGWKTLAEIQGPTDPLAATVRQRTGLDIDETMREHSQWISQHIPPSPPPPPSADLAELQKMFLDAARAVVSSGVAEVLAGWGEALVLPQWSHRIRGAIGGLRACIRRSESDRDERFVNAGRMYAEGRLTVHQAAEVLGMPEWDVIAEFENHHFCRPADVIVLPDQERSARLAQLRQQRQSRSRQSDPERVARSVVATQRIECLDARKWMPTNES